jgi:hypothetical protein
VGDFYIVHTKSGQRATVELKQRVASISPAGEFQHANGLRTKKGGKFRRYFTPMTQWDFLLTSWWDIMILLSRDDLPQDWFEQLSEEWLRWTPDTDFLRNHTLSIQNFGKSFVRQVEQILNSYRPRSGLRAKLSRPFTVVPYQEILAQMDDGDEDDLPSTPSTTTQTLRGSGSRWSRRLFETLHEDWMWNQYTRQ